jgi:hypothetical protein
VPRKMNATRRKRAAHHNQVDGPQPDPFFEQFEWAPGSYLFERLDGDEVVVNKAHNSSGSLRLQRRCLDCGLTHPLCGFAPVFNASPSGAETLILVCWSCYSRREKVEDADREMALWHQRDEARQAKQRARSRRFYDKYRKAG